MPESWVDPFDELKDLGEQEGLTRLNLALGKGSSPEIQIKDDSLMSRSTQIKTLDELLETTKTDLTRWKVSRHQINKWPVGASHPDTGQILVEELFQVKAWLEPVAEKDFDYVAYFDKLREEAADWAPKIKYEYGERKKGERILCELDPLDVHFGKFAWAPETGENYDLKIAEERFKDSITTLLHRAKAFGVDRFYIPLGHDLLNSDNLYYQTTSQKHVVDEDGRWTKSFDVAFRCCSWMVEEALKIAPLDVKYIPGNHSRQREFYLMYALASWYRNSQDVTFDLSPASHKIYEFGSNLIFQTHGDGLKLKDIPQFVASVYPDAWGRTKFRYGRTGHKHHYIRMETGGMVLEQQPSISGTDAWHFNNGYAGNIKAMKAYVYSETAGEIANFTANY